MFYFGNKDQTVKTRPFLTFRLSVQMAEGGSPSGMDEEDG